MSRANRLAVAAAVLAVQDAGLEDTDLTSAGLCVGVGQSPPRLKDILPAAQRSTHQWNFLDLDRFVDEGMSYMNPLSSLKTLPNIVSHMLGFGSAFADPAGLCAPMNGPGLMRLAKRFNSCAMAERLQFLSALPMRKRFADRLALGRDQIEHCLRGAAFFVLECVDPARADGLSPYTIFQPDSPLPSFSERIFGHCGAATLALGYALSLGRSGRNQSAIGSNERRGNIQPPAAHSSETFACCHYCGWFVLRSAMSWNSSKAPLLTGRSAVQPITAFDASNFPVKNACEASLPALSELTKLDQGFGVLRGISDRKSELALYAARRAAQSHGCLERPAVIFGTGLSSVSARELEEDCFPYFDSDGQFDYNGLGRTVSYRRDNPLGGIKLAAPRLILQPDQARIMQPTSAHALRPERRLLMVWSVYAGAMINRYLPVVPTRWCTHMGSYPSFYWVQPHRSPTPNGRASHSTKIVTVLSWARANLSYLNQQKLRVRKVEKSLACSWAGAAAAIPITSRPAS